jgi:Protein of unknown function (DUF2510)
MSESSPGWYSDPTQAGTLRYFDGAAWTTQVAPAPAAGSMAAVGTIAPFATYGPKAPSAIGADPSDPVHWLLPTGRTWQSIAAGYVALFGILLWFLGPVAMGLGIWGLIASHKGGAHGRGRAIFAIVMGVLETIALILILTLAWATRDM